MTEYHVGTLEELGPSVRKIVEFDDVEVVVFQVQGEVFAYENRCLHMGGPAGEGLVLGRTEARLDDGKRLICEDVSDTNFQLICPWHSWAYDVRTGEFAGDRSLRLRKFDTRVEGQDVYLAMD